MSTDSHFRVGIVIWGRSPELLDGIGAIYSVCDEQTKALAFFERAVAAQADNAYLFYNLATAQRKVGQLAQAEKSCDCVIELKPQDYIAYYTRAGLRPWTSYNNHIQEMESLLWDTDKFNSGAPVTMHASADSM